MHPQAKIPRLDRRGFLSVLAGGLASTRLGSANPRQSERPGKPNVVVFLVDDMGFADVGCYGAKDIRTPNIDRLAREGVRFTDFYSSGPVCTPTRAALMTGRYQQRVGLEWALMPADKGKGLPASETSIARMLKGNGYATGMFGKWHLGFEREVGPNAHGFDEFFGLLSGNIDLYSHKYRTGFHDLYENTELVERKGYLTELIGERSAAWIEKNAGRPFFAYVPFNAVHWPFQPPGRPDDVRTLATWYDGTREDYAKMTESVDQAVGKVMDVLRRRNLDRNTLVIFTNDNGGERLSDNGPFFHHKATVWEGGIRVPAIARWPGQIPAGKTTPQVAATMDLTATILSATGTQPPAGRKLDGIDLMPVLRGEKQPSERALFWRIDRADRKQKAVRQGQWKYVKDGEIEMLFDIVKDPGERDTVAFQNQDVMKRLRQAVEAWEKDLAKTPPPFVVK